MTHTNSLQDPEMSVQTFSILKIAESNENAPADLTKAVSGMIKKNQSVEALVKANDSFISLETAYGSYAEALNDILYATQEQQKSAEYLHADNHALVTVVTLKTDDPQFLEDQKIAARTYFYDEELITHTTEDGQSLMNVIIQNDNDMTVKLAVDKVGKTIGTRRGVDNLVRAAYGISP